jgi:phage baseplate assembly protein W
MSNISPKLPLTYNSEDGFYHSFDDLVPAMHQNLKNLILTSPGERIMDSNFGVGLYNMLFEQDSIDLDEKIRSRIVSQVSLYIPVLEITSVDFYRNHDVISNYINVNIIYSLPMADTALTLELNISNIA